jgi:hypothetical protein
MSQSASHLDFAGTRFHLTSGIPSLALTKRRTAGVARDNTRPDAQIDHIRAFSALTGFDQNPRRPAGNARRPSAGETGIYANG